MKSWRKLRKFHQWESSNLLLEQLFINSKQTADSAISNLNIVKRRIVSVYDLRTSWRSICKLFYKVWFCFNGKRFASLNPLISLTNVVCMQRFYELLTTKLVKLGGTINFLMNAFWTLPPPPPPGADRLACLSRSSRPCKCKLPLTIQIKYLLFVLKNIYHVQKW